MGNWQANLTQNEADPCDGSEQVLVTTGTTGVILPATTAAPLPPSGPQVNLPRPYEITEQRSVQPNTQSSKTVTLFSEDGYQVAVILPAISANVEFNFINAPASFTSVLPDGTRTHPRIAWGSAPNCSCVSGLQPTKVRFEITAVVDGSPVDTYTFSGAPLKIQITLPKVRLQPVARRTSHKLAC